MQKSLRLVHNSAKIVSVNKSKNVSPNNCIVLIFTTVFPLVSAPGANLIPKF